MLGFYVGSDINQQKECFHYTNLQPLWTEENRSKSSSYKGKKYSVNINNKNYGE